MSTHSKHSKVSTRFKNELASLYRKDRAPLAPPIDRGAVPLDQPGPVTEAGSGAPLPAWAVVSAKFGTIAMGAAFMILGGHYLDWPKLLVLGAFLLLAAVLTRPWEVPPQSEREGPAPLLRRGQR